MNAISNCNRLILLFTYILSISFASLNAFDISKLSLEQKVGQLLMVHFNGHQVNAESKKLIQELYIGGIIYYPWSNGLTSPEQILHLSQDLQDLAQQNKYAIPLLIAVDQEGGRVNRLSEGFTLFPSSFAIGRTDNLHWGKQVARIVGQELKAVGINLNLAPVVDVYTEIANPVIGIRSFDADPEKVALWGKVLLEGYQQSGVIAALKHFPGHGDVKSDSHLMLPKIDKTFAEMELTELVPFYALAAKADIVMTGHLYIPALDEVNCATFSKKIVQKLLREKIGFQGVVMTDSLLMQGILDQKVTLEEAVLKSVNAGHDLILLGGRQLLSSGNQKEFTFQTIKQIHHFLVEAVQEGSLSEQRLNEAVTRILSLKQKYHLFDFDQLDIEKLKSSVGLAKHQEFAKEVSRQTIRLIKNQENFLPFSIRHHSLLIVAPEILKESIENTSWNQSNLNQRIVYFKDLNPDVSDIQLIKEKCMKNERCIYFSYNMWKSDGQQTLFQYLVNHSDKTLAIVVCDPLDNKYVSQARAILNTFSPITTSLQAAYDYLEEGVKCLNNG